VDPDAEQFLQVLDEPRVVEQTPARLPGDQQVEVARFVGLAARHLAEHADIVSAAPLGQAQDIVPPFCPQCVQREHLSSW